MPIHEYRVETMDTETALVPNTMQSTGSHPFDPCRIAMWNHLYSMISPEIHHSVYDKDGQVSGNQAHHTQNQKLVLGELHTGDNISLDCPSYIY